MLSRIDKNNSLYSFVIGAIIGLVAYLSLNSAPDAGSLLLCAFISGVIGLVVGIVIMVAMSLLPVKIAKTRLYFIIGNLLALLVTAAIILTIYFIGVEDFNSRDLLVVLAIAFPVIILANILEYVKYKKTNRKLIDFIERKTGPQ